MQNITKSLILKECSVLFYCSWRFRENPISEFCCSTAHTSKCISYQHLPWTGVHILYISEHPITIEQYKYI